LDLTESDTQKGVPAQRMVCGVQMQKCNKPCATSKDASVLAVLRGRHCKCVQNQSSFLPSHQTLITGSTTSELCATVCVSVADEGRPSSSVRFTMCCPLGWASMHCCCTLQCRRRPCRAHKRGVVSVLCSPDAVRRMLPHLMSRCTLPKECR